MESGQKEQKPPDFDTDSSSQNDKVSDSSFEAPAKDPHNKEIFEKYKGEKVIDEEEDESEDFSFIIKNLDTGESMQIANEQHERIFDEKHSLKRKCNCVLTAELSKNYRLNAWDSFWKTVHMNNQQLWAAAENGDIQIVKTLVLQGKNNFPVQINSKGPDEWTALHFAAYENNVDVVQFLLQHGANVNVCTRFIRTPLHIATIRGHITTVTILCSFQVDIDFQDEDGNTALHFAVQNEYPQIVQYILKRTKNILKNKIGKYPSDVCRSDTLKQLLQKYGVNTKKLEKKENSKIMAKDDKKDNRIQKVQLTMMSQQTLSPTSFTYFKVLGKGSFGEVFLVQKKGETKLYAMKVLSKDKILGKNLVRYAMTERNVLSAMNHPFIVKLNYAFQNETKLFLVMDYCPGGDLGKLLVKKKMLTEDEARMYISQLILAFEALHKNMIVFRDLKPDNVVLDEQGHARLTDFGLSKQGVYNNTTESFCGSVAYLAPQVLNKEGHSRTVDWYLVGLLIYELIVGIPPYYNSKKEVLFENIKKGPLKIPKNMSEAAKDLIKRLLNRNPKHRLGAVRDADELKEHKFFAGVNWNDVLNRRLPVPSVEVPPVNLNETIKVNFNDRLAEKVERINNWTFVNSA